MTKELAWAETIIIPSLTSQELMKWHANRVIDRNGRHKYMLECTCYDLLQIYI